MREEEQGRGGWRGMGKEAGAHTHSSHLCVELVADDADEGSGDLGEEGLEGVAAAVHGQLTQGGGAHLTHVLTAVHEAVLVQRHQGSQTSGDGEGCMGGPWERMGRRGKGVVHSGGGKWIIKVSTGMHATLDTPAIPRPSKQLLWSTSKAQPTPSMRSTQQSHTQAPRTRKRAPASRKVDPTMTEPLRCLASDTMDRRRPQVNSRCCISSSGVILFTNCSPRHNSAPNKT
jgi:hypothetical protein